MTNPSLTSSDQLPIQDYRIRIAHDGKWYHDGSVIEREPLVRLFATVLKRKNDGKYWLETPAERGVVEVEDAPFVVVAARLLEHDGNAPVLGLDTNLGHHIIVGADYPIYTAISPVTGEITPYVRMDQGLSAKISRAVYYDLVEWGRIDEVQGQRVLGIDSDGQFFSLGPVDAH